jgi:hypothetical protein
MSPLAHEIGDAPPGQVTWQGFVALQATWQVPKHSTTQVLTASHEMVLPGPACTPQRSTFQQSYWQLAPQNAPHEVVSWQLTAQWSPQDALQSTTLWHSRRQPLPQTPPQ